MKHRLIRFGLGFVFAVTPALAAACGGSPSDGEADESIAPVAKADAGTNAAELHTQAKDVKKFGPQ